MALIIPHNLIIHSFAQGPCGCVQRPQTSSQTSFPQKSKRSVQSGCVKHNVQNMVLRGQEHASIWKHQSFRKLCVELDQLPLVFSKDFLFHNSSLQVTTKTGDTSHLYLEPKNRIGGFLWAEPMLRGLLPWVPQVGCKEHPYNLNQVVSYGVLIGWPEFREAKVQQFEGFS